VCRICFVKLIVLCIIKNIESYTKNNN